MRLALVIEYEGTRYHGFQWQANATTIQGELEKAIERFTGEKTRVKGAGRTDTGVHARGQVVAFDTGSDYPPETFVQALNAGLPEDIAVREAYRARDSFDPRREATSREYRYTILNSSTPSPLLRRFAALVRKPLDTEAMKQACQALKGVHDFACFSGPLRKGESAIRQVYQARVWVQQDKVIFDVESNAFLPQQVRRMAGVLVEVGLSKMSVGEFVGMVRCGAPGAATSAMSPMGLCLMRVNYRDFPPEIGDTHDN